MTSDRSAPFAGLRRQRAGHVGPQLTEQPPSRTRGYVLAGE